MSSHRKLSYEYQCRSKSSLSILIYLAQLVTLATGQSTVGVDICACSPSFYEFTFHFNLTSCPPLNVPIGQGVVQTSCLVTGLSDDVTDFTPVVIETVQILEFDTDLKVQVQKHLDGNFFDGDSFNFTSFIAQSSEPITANKLTRAIQLTHRGLNANGDLIIQTYMIAFSNSCGDFPVLRNGIDAGWTRFTHLHDPPPSLCPISLQQSQSPKNYGTSSHNPSPSPSVSSSLRSKFPSSPAMSMSMSMSMMIDLESEDIREWFESEIRLS